MPEYDRLGNALAVIVLEDTMSSLTIHVENGDIRKFYGGVMIQDWTRHVCGNDREYVRNMLDNTVGFRIVEA